MRMSCRFGEADLSVRRVIADLWINYSASKYISGDDNELLPDASQRRNEQTPDSKRWIDSRTDWIRFWNGDYRQIGA